ncbi:alpha-glucosidase [uncultured Erythrobacter sp.]|uniref:alpha-glucosidase n=1 Tax=uncultured Erythrobacter sp. TaxID=263913 RepID=UPI00265AD324|nr:alpha-glucosidase [uncultured Erythrobacter sp.]
MIALEQDPASASAPDTADWRRGAVVYQIYPRSFADSDGDGIGDLPGITARLDYIASLGVDAVWISPFFVSPMHDYGYDVADYRDVDPQFGTLADFDALLAKAHGLGLKILVDLVFAHTSHLHPWFVASRSGAHDPKADWYVWAEPKPDGSPPNNWQSVFTGSAWTWDAQRKRYYMHNFLPQQPQLNVHHLEVQDALLDVMRFWLERGVDGFRLDAINFAMHNPALTDNPPAASNQRRTRPFDYQSHVHNQSQSEIIAFLQRLRGLADSFGATFLVGEIGGEWSASEMKSYTAGDAQLHSAYSFAFLSAPKLASDHVRATLGEWGGTPEEGWPSWAFSNHDAPRVISRWTGVDGTPLPAGLTLALLMALRGNLFLYQGEELGLPQADLPFEALRDPEAIANWPETMGRDGARTPMPWAHAAPEAGFTTGQPWLPIVSEHRALAVDVQEADPGSTLQLARQLIALRRSRLALRVGALAFLETEPQLLGFDRSIGDERLRCLFNLAPHPVAAPQLEGWKPVMRIGADAGPIRIGAFGAIIAERA